MRLDDALVRDLVAGRYAFVDAGCAAGASIDHCERRFGLGRGLGLDWYQGDLDVARNNGFDVALCNLLEQELPPKCVAFASAVCFLEHLPDEASAVRVMERVAAAARDFVFVRHPSFDDIDYLAQFGLKFGWTDWSSHPNMMTTDDFRRVFEALGWRDYRIVPHMGYADSTHPSIVPASAPRDTEVYDEALHGPKPFVRFDHTVYAKFDIFVRLNPDLPDDAWRRIASVDGWEGIWTD
jgi:hypothetical protein